MDRLTDRQTDRQPVCSQKPIMLCAVRSANKRTTNVPVASMADILSTSITQEAQLSLRMPFVLLSFNHTEVVGLELHQVQSERTQGDITVLRK